MLHSFQFWALTTTPPRRRRSSWAQEVTLRFNFFDAVRTLSSAIAACDRLSIERCRSPAAWTSYFIGLLIIPAQNKTGRARRFGRFGMDPRSRRARSRSCYGLGIAQIDLVTRIRRSAEGSRESALPVEASEVRFMLRWILLPKYSVYPGATDGGWHSCAHAESTRVIQLKRNIAS